MDGYTLYFIVWSSGLLLILSIELKSLSSYLIIEAENRIKDDNNKFLCVLVHNYGVMVIPLSVVPRHWPLVFSI